MNHLLLLLVALWTVLEKEPMEWVEAFTTRSRELSVRHAQEDDKIAPVEPALLKLAQLVLRRHQLARGEASDSQRASVEANLFELRRGVRSVLEVGRAVRALE